MASGKIAGEDTKLAQIGYNTPTSVLLVRSALHPERAWLHILPQGGQGKEDEAETRGLQDPAVSFEGMTEATCCCRLCLWVGLSVTCGPGALWGGGTPAPGGGGVVVALGFYATRSFQAGTSMASCSPQCTSASARSPMPCLPGLAITSRPNKNPELQASPVCPSAEGYRRHAHRPVVPAQSGSAVHQ